ncbi:hypothetical protein K3495_g6940 [Podosphaera aphanis]|nr:hypothetical protein K3495_g6940 [Podosphaera aphanis]
MATTAIVAISYQSDNTGGIGIAYKNEKNIFKVTGEENVQEILWPLAVLCALKVVPPTTRLQIITGWPGCESFQNTSVQDNEMNPTTGKKPARLVHEILDACRQEILFIKNKNRDVKFKYVTRKDKNYDLKTASSCARMALNRKSLDDSMILSKKPVNFIIYNRIQVFAILMNKSNARDIPLDRAVADREAVTAHSSNSSKKAKKPAVILSDQAPVNPEATANLSKKSKKAVVTEIDQGAEKSHNVMPSAQPSTEVIGNKEQVTLSKGIVFASCSRCAAIVCISCPNPSESTRRMPYIPQKNPILVLTTCRRCIEKMTPNTINAPSIDEVAAYLEDVFSCAPLASGYITGSEVFRRVIDANKDTCIASYADNCIRYIDIGTLNLLRDPTCDVRVVDQYTGELSCILASDFFTATCSQQSLI